MKAMVLETPGSFLSFRTDLPVPEPGPGEVLVKIKTCAVCRTDLHVIDGELPNPKLPLIPGHEIVGVVASRGDGVKDLNIGDRVGVPWLGWTCGQCEFCLSGRENLCDAAKFTGYTRDGGYAEYTVAHAAYCLRIPASITDVKAAPLLCAGLIGYRSLQKTGGARSIGIYGFGAAGHLVAQIAHYQRRAVFAFTTPGDSEAQAFARRMGAIWAGDSTQPSPELLDAAIIFAPVGGLVPMALRSLKKGGTLVCAGIHMSDIPSFPYSSLWHERSICSVANLTRRDGEEFFAVAALSGVQADTREFPLDAANEALRQLRKGELTGAAVLIVDR